MRPSILIAETPRYRVRSYNFGLAYTLEHRTLGKDILFQGDDANSFRERLQTLTEGPRFHLSYGDALELIWQDYADVADLCVAAPAPSYVVQRPARHLSADTL